VPSEISAQDKAEKKTQLLDLLKKHDMSFFYSQVNTQFGWEPDAEVLSQLKAKNETKLKELETKIEEAKKNAGDTEVREAVYNKAVYLATIGDKKTAMEVYEAAYEKTVGAGKRIDLVFDLIRLAMATGDTKMVKDNIERARKLVEEGGDWERKNLLGVYEALYLITIRDWKEAVKLFLASVATFTAYELFPYETLIFYTVLLSAVCLDRPTLREKVIRSPDILTVIHEIPNLKEFLFSLYECKYADFFNALAKLVDQVKKDRSFSAHAPYFLREIRVVAYTQFLESYKSVTFASMANAFGVSTAFLDRELSRFIAAGRLNAKIDKVGGVVETMRPDARNVQYQDSIKHGDVLLTR